MSKKTICKTIHQYNQNPISETDMEKLQEIALDYSRVKNYVYQRYGGITGLSKLYPGYTVQNEMTESGLRGSLGLPAVYFYLAVFDALRDIRNQWVRTKSKVLYLIGRNECLTGEEKHYLYFLLKVSNAFEAVLNENEIVLYQDIQRHHDELAKKVDTKKLHGYLRRQVRKYHMKLHTDTAEGFSIAERAYRYADHGIYISVKEKRKRIFVALTDSNRYKAQLYIVLYPERRDIEIKVPVNVLIREHKEYTNEIGLSMGMFTLLTTDEGHKYGEKLGEYQTEYADWIRKQTGIYNRNRNNNTGRKKYTDKKKRYEEQLHSYINHELNLFLKTEKPQTLYIPKLPKPKAGGINRKINHTVTLWQRGYIQKRLIQKCMEQSVELIEVFGKDISNECSRCGEPGIKKDGIFMCSACGYQTEEKINAACNAKKRGQDDRILY